MRRFVSKDSKRDFYILYTLVFGVIAGVIYYQFAGSLWCGVTMGFRSI